MNSNKSRALFKGEKEKKTVFDTYYVVEGEI